jgi:ankyrin repeat protein
MTDNIITSNSQSVSTANVLEEVRSQVFQPAIPNDQTCLQIQNGNHPLRNAAANGDLAGVKFLMEKETHIPWDYVNALYFAAKEGHDEIVKYLVELKGKSVHEEKYKDIPISEVLRKKGVYANQAQEALYEAVNNNRIKVVEYLLQQRIGKFPRVLAWAAEAGNLEMVRYLIEHVTDFTRIKKGILDKAAYKSVLNGYLEILKYLVEHGANINTLQTFTYTQPQDNALLAASRLGNLEIVKYLVEQGADIYAKNGEAILIAINKEHIDIIKYLVEKGANISTVPFYQDYLYIPEYRYALPAASRLGNLEIVKYLVEQGTDIHAYNEAALHVAIKYEHLNIIRYLIEQGSHTNALHGSRYTRQENALSAASRLGNLEVVKCLVEQGADIHAYNEAALHIAAANGKLGIVKYLAEKGADIHTCKGCAFIGGSGNPEVVKYLAEHGVDIYARDRQKMPERTVV